MYKKSNPALTDSYGDQDNSFLEFSFEATTWCLIKELN